MKLRPKTEKDFNNILDCMTGADGGVSFMKLKILLEDLDSQAASGNSAAIQLMDIMAQFSKLIDVASK